MVILDGKKYSAEIINDLKNVVDGFKNTVGKVPGLAVIIVGDDQASKVYVNSKIRACEKIGIKSVEVCLPENTSEEEVLNKIEELNNDKEINGILVQLPLPKHISEKKVTEKISVTKDVDGFKPENLGKIMMGDDSGFISCTPQGIMYLIEQTKVELYGMTACVLGRSNIVGKPISSLLINKGATVVTCNSRTKNLEEIIKNSDIIVAAIGQAKFVKENMVKEGAIVIDVGINRLEGKLVGDVDFENIKEKSSYITPVPGGVGPMTIAMLMKNTVQSFVKEEI